MKTAKGEFIAIFDADFVPPEDFLMRTIHHFTDPKIGMVQTRWTHINRNYSFLTEVEAILLDGHFVLEHSGRARSNVFFNFNGTAGVWRRSAIEEAGGWQHDTLTEDTDLSYRAQLKGWKFIYLQDVECPAELPVEMTAFKTQQARWAKGLIQTAKKILPSVMKSDQPFRVKLEAWYHLTANLSYPLMVVLSVLLLPAMIIRFYQGWFQMLYIDLPLFMASTFSISSFYLVSQRELFPETWPRALLYLPFLMALGIGLTITNTRAVLEALIGTEVGLRAHSQVSRGIEEGQDQRHQIPAPPGLGALGRTSDRQLLRAYRLLRHRQRELHHRAVSGFVRGRLLVHGIDVFVAGPLLGPVAERGDPHQAVSGGRVGDSESSCLESRLGSLCVHAFWDRIVEARTGSTSGTLAPTMVTQILFPFSLAQLGLESVPLRALPGAVASAALQGGSDAPPHGTLPELSSAFCWFSWSVVEPVTIPG